MFPNEASFDAPGEVRDGLEKMRRLDGRIAIKRRFPRTKPISMVLSKFVTVWGK
jgi:hypothetical protein